MGNDIIDPYDVELGHAGANVFIRDSARLYMPRYIEVGDRCYIGYYCELVSRPGKIVLGDDVTLRTHVYIDIAMVGGSVRIGDRTWVGPYAMLYGHSGLVIGEDCLISPRATIISYKHEWRDPDNLIKRQGGAARPISIGDDVYIGTMATVMASVGKGSVVGAGAVVTKDVPAYVVVAGNPAHIIKRRE